MLVEPKPDMKDYMYLYRLVVFVISIAYFPQLCMHTSYRLFHFCFCFTFSLETLVLSY